MLLEEAVGCYLDQSICTNQATAAQALLGPVLTTLMDSWQWLKMGHCCLSRGRPFCRGARCKRVLVAESLVQLPNFSVSLNWFMLKISAWELLSFRSGMCLLLMIILQFQ